jgi:RimJ/RimL family protein N-acetyltransferase
MSEILQTKRLRLRELTHQDAQFIIELTNSPAWLKFIGDRNTKTEALAKAYIERVGTQNYKTNGSGLYLVELKDTKIPIGLCGIMHRQTLENPDIAFAFLPQYEGKGYAYEIASELINYTHKVLKINALMAIVLPENERSIRLIEKLGMKFIKKFRFENDDEELLLYKILF